MYNTHILKFPTCDSLRSDGSHLATFPGISWMCSTGSPSNRGFRTSAILPGRRFLRSTEQGLLLVPFFHTATMQNRAFSVVGLSLWNGLSLALRLFPRIVSNSFYAHLKTFILGLTGTKALLSSRLEGAL